MEKKKRIAKAGALLTGAYFLGKGIAWFSREADNFPIPLDRAMEIGLSASRGRMTNRDYRDFSRVLPVGYHDDESRMHGYPKR